MTDFKRSIKQLSLSLDVLDQYKCPLTFVSKTRCNLWKKKTEKKQFSLPDSEVWIIKIRTHALEEIKILMYWKKTNPMRYFCNKGKLSHQEIKKGKSWASKTNTFKKSEKRKKKKCNYLSDELNVIKEGTSCSKRTSGCTFDVGPLRPQAGWGQL